MIIEFNTAYKVIPEEVINDIRRQVLELSHISKKISRVEVLIKEDNLTAESDRKICQVQLNYSDGDEIVAHTRAGDFSQAAHESINELRKMINQQVKHQKDLPDIIMSSVKV